MFNGYVAAKVGSGPGRLRSMRQSSGVIGQRSWPTEQIDGLVLCEALHEELGLGGNYVEFQPGYLWIPYRRREAKHAHS